MWHATLNYQLSCPTERGFVGRAAPRRGYLYPVPFPKWLWPVAPWLSPACFLYYVQHTTKVLATNDYFSNGDKLTVVDLPVANVPTLYTRFGDWLAWLCVGLLALFSVRAMAGRMRQKRTAKVAEEKIAAY